MRVVVLGTGQPEPKPDRAGTSILVDIEGTTMLFDCGPGATVRAVEAGYHPTAFDYVFLSHHHFDHTLDLPHLALTRWQFDVGGMRALRVFGPRGTEAMVEGLFGEGGAYDTDQIARTKSIRSLELHKRRGGGVPRERVRVIARDVRSGVVCTGADWTVTTTIVEHVEWLDSQAYRVDKGENSVVIAGDTIACRSLLDLAEGADTLIWSCVTNGSDVIAGPESAARLAAAAGVRQLVLHHFDPRVDDPAVQKEVEQSIRTEFAGELVLATRDLWKLDLPR